MNHLQSLKFENKLYAMVKDKMEEMQQHNMSWIEVQFLKKSLDILCECRRTLMYTYVFAYYLRKNNQSAIFEVGRKASQVLFLNNINFFLGQPEGLRISHRTAERVP